MCVCVYITEYTVNVLSLTLSLRNEIDGDSICSGRVEVLSNNQWGTVCGDSWDMTDAVVVCRELGCGSPVEVNKGAYGSGIGPIWMDDVKCTGTEATLRHCRSNGWGVHDCKHASDAGVVCRGELPDSIFLLFFFFSSFFFYMYMFPKYISMYEFIFIFFLSTKYTGD